MGKNIGICEDPQPLYLPYAGLSRIRFEGSVLSPAPLGTPDTPSNMPGLPAGTTVILTRRILEIQLLETGREGRCVLSGRAFFPVNPLHDFCFFLQPNTCSTRLQSDWEIEMSRFSLNALQRRVFPFVKADDPTSFLVLLSVKMWRRRALEMTSLPHT